MAKAKLKVDSMTCEHCVKTVKETLRGINGVRRASVDLEAGRAAVDYDEGRTDPRTLAAAVTEQGYSAEPLA